MKAFIIYFSIAIFVVLLLLCSLRLLPRYQYAKHQDIIMNESEPLSKDSLKVLLLGDSWTFLHKQYDSQLCSMINKKGFPCSVISKGFSGAKSKEIFLNLSASCMSLMMERATYCVITVGINDAVAKLGKEFYSYHYILILQQLLKMGIKPVVLEIPEVNYHAIANRESLVMRLYHRLSSIITGSEMYGFHSYREDLKMSIKKLGIDKRIIYVSSNAWNEGGYKDFDGLYLPDEVHLNSYGYYKLDSCLASIITDDLTH